MQGTLTQAQEKNRQYRALTQTLVKQNASLHGQLKSAPQGRMERKEQKLTVQAKAQAKVRRQLSQLTKEAKKTHESNQREKARLKTARAALNEKEDALAQQEDVNGDDTDRECSEDPNDSDFVPEQRAYRAEVSLLSWLDEQHAHQRDQTSAANNAPYPGALIQIVQAQMEREIAASNASAVLRECWIPFLDKTHPGIDIGAHNSHITPNNRE
jgi:chromosome segregation ATPase